jgi:hypothetical protein
VTRVSCWVFARDLAYSPRITNHIETANAAAPNYACGPDPSSGEFSLQVAAAAAPASQQAVRSKGGACN